MLDFLCVREGGVCAERMEKKSLRNLTQKVLEGQMVLASTLLDILKD